MYDSVKTVKSPRVTGMATGPRHGDTVQGDPARKHGWRTVRKVTGVHTSKPVR